MIDTGSPISLILNKYIDNEEIVPNSQSLIGASGHELQNKGITIKTLFYNNKRFDQLFYVLDNLPNKVDCILGMDFLQSTKATIYIQRGKLKLELESNINREQRLLNTYKLNKLKSKTEFTSTKTTKTSEATRTRNFEGRTGESNMRLTKTNAQADKEPKQDDKLKVFFVNENGKSNTELLRTISKVMIPPKSSKIIEAKCNNKKDRLVIIEKNAASNIEIEHTVNMISNNGKSCVFILNESEEVLHLDKNTIIAQATTLNETLTENTLLNKNIQDSELSGDTGETRDDLFPLINEKSNEERITILNKWVSEQRYSGETGEFLANLIKKYSKTFHVEGDGHSPVPNYEYDIELKDKNARIKSKSYPIPHNAEGEVHRQVNELLRIGIISKHVSDHVNPLVVVKSKNKVRLVLDLRETNKLIKDAVFEMPDLRDALARLGNKTMFTTLDLKQAFLSIKLGEESRKYTAFCVRNLGTYCYNRLPFGLKTSPRIFFQHMIKVIQEVNDPDVLFYIDDIIISSKTKESHEKSIKRLFDVLEKHCLKVNIEKSCWFAKKVKFLGHEITTNGMRPDPGKIELTDKIKRPASVKQVRSFLGLANFFRNFIPDLSTISDPMTDLTRKKQEKKFVWTEKAEESFIEIKKRLKANLKLKYPDFGKKFYLQTDASDIGSGGLLYQLDDFGQVQPNAFLSKSFSKAERNFSTYEKEMLAVLHGLRQVRHLVLFSEISLLTDHKPIIYLMKSTKKSMSSRNIRWIIELGEYNLSLNHIKGTENNIADFLSRLKEEFETPAKECVGMNAVFNGLHEYNKASRKSGTNVEYIKSIINDQVTSDETTAKIELPETGTTDRNVKTLTIQQNCNNFHLLDDKEINDLIEKQRLNEKLNKIINELEKNEQSLSHEQTSKVKVVNVR